MQNHTVLPDTTQLIALSGGLYIDAFVLDSNNQVVFLSLWARDGEMQHFFAALSLPIALILSNDNKVSGPFNIHTLALSTVSRISRRHL